MHLVVVVVLPHLVEVQVIALLILGRGSQVIGQITIVLLLVFTVVDHAATWGKAGGEEILPLIFLLVIILNLAKLIVLGAQAQVAIQDMVAQDLLHFFLILVVLTKNIIVQEVVVL